MRTPRDTLRLNQENNMQLVGQTPRELRLHENAKRDDLRSRLSALPKPKETSWEFELPEEQEVKMEVEGASSALTEQEQTAPPTVQKAEEVTAPAEDAGTGGTTSEDKQRAKSQGTLSVSVE